MLCAATPALAQGDALRKIEPDRPNRTNTPSTLDAGHLQLELGAFDTILDREGADARTRSWSIASLNARYGVTGTLELNMVIAPHDVLHDRDAGYARGFGDTIVGAKLNLWGDGAEDGTALAIQPQVKLPTAREPLGNGHAEVDLNVPFHASGPAGFGVGAMATASWLRSDANTHYVAGWQGSVALDHDVGPADLYAEYAVSDTAEHGQPAAHLAGIGALVQASDNVVFDAATEIGLSRGADDFRVLSGVTVRF